MQVQSTVNNMHFLWAAYLLVAISNIGFALWLRSRWVALTSDRRVD